MIGFIMRVWCVMTRGHYFIFPHKETVFMGTHPIPDLTRGVCMHCGYERTTR